ncbi:MAG: hypothetical protein SFU57_00200 [Gemmatimonadales bacterium]|nr:hypothetical protein [Gemmatimonadales bacterium]
MTDTFSADLSRIAEKYRGQLKQVCQESARDLYNEVSSGGDFSPGTPIANPSLWKEPRPHVGGFARGSWSASLNGMPGEGAGTAGEADAQVEATIEGLKVGDTLMVANRAPYIRRLEYDAHSTQAPDGFVRPAVEAWHLIVDRIIARVVGSGSVR